MKKLLYTGIILAVLFGAVGCGSSADDSDNNERCVGAPDVILDNDHFDPDWLVTLVTAIGLDQNCQIDLKAVIVGGTDTNNKAGLMYQTVLQYYGISERIPLGKSKADDQRVTPTAATRENPKISSEYIGEARNILELPSDGIYDTDRISAVEVLCQVLEESGGNITYVTGGNLHSLADILKETERCDGLGLFTAKVQRAVIASGWSMSAQGKPEMNHSEGVSYKTGTSIASNYVFKHMPTSIPIEFPNNGGYASRGSIGNQYKSGIHSNSPMAFVYAVPTYGTFGDHGLGDSAALTYTAFGNTIYDTQVIKERRKVCFVSSPKNGSITLGKCDANHWLNIVANPAFEYNTASIVNALVDQPIAEQ